MNSTMVREIRGAKINPKSSFNNQGAQNTRGRKLRNQIRYYENKITDTENSSFPVSNLVSSGLLPRNTGLQRFICIGLDKSLFVTFALSPYSQLLPYKQQACFCTLQTSRNTDLSRQFAVPGLSGKYRVILNISRNGRVALMELGSQSEETLL